MHSHFLLTTTADETSTPLRNVELDMDCSKPNEITMEYSVGRETDFSYHGISIPIELLLNCSTDGFQVSRLMSINSYFTRVLISLQNELLCLFDNFGGTDVAGPYTLIDENENVIVPGATCFVTTCFSTPALIENFRTPPHSCLTGSYFCYLIT